MFATMKPYAPPPPPGAQPPPLWGARTTSGHCSATGSSEVTAEPARCRSTGSPRREAFRDYFKANYGPTIAVYRVNADDPEKVAALDRDLAELGRRFDRGDGPPSWTGSTCCSPPAAVTA